MIYWFYRLVAHTPELLSYWLADLGAWLLEHAFRYRRQVIDDNLRRAFPEKSLDQCAQLRREFYAHLADTTVEIIRAREMSDEAFLSRVEIANPEVITAATASLNQSAIVLTLHQGNWEWMLQRAALEFSIQQAAVYKRLHNAGADRFSHEVRAKRGAQTVEMRTAARNVLKHRRTPRLIFLIGDQSPGKRERVHWSNFMNQPTAFFAGAESLARATGFPVLFASCRRTTRGQYRIFVEEISMNPKELAEGEIMEQYARLTERAIIAEPASWLWSNRRWKRQADSATSSKATGETST